jgi:hypothetical protein
MCRYSGIHPPTHTHTLPSFAKIEGTRQRLLMCRYSGILRGAPRASSAGNVEILDPLQGRTCNPVQRPSLRGAGKSGDVEVTRADGSHHSHQDRPRGPVETMPWRMPPAARTRPQHRNTPVVHQDIRAGGGSEELATTKEEGRHGVTKRRMGRCKRIHSRGAGLVRSELIPIGHVATRGP